jgi:glycosyltransferase involved in cell wall biosynthesis
VPPEAIGATEVEPKHPEQFSRDLAAAVNVLLDDPDLRASMASSARKRVEQRFSWTSIARQTLEFYQELILHRRRGPW